MTKKGVEKIMIYESISLQKYTNLITLINVIVFIQLKQIYFNLHFLIKFKK